MVARNRSTSYARVTGQRGYWNQAPPNYTMSTYVTDYSSVSDITGPGDCAPFNVYTLATEGGVIEKLGSGGFSSWFNHYLADILRNSANFNTHLSTSSPSNIFAATLAAARTNPSRPYVDVPLNVFDMKAGIQRMKDRAFALRKRHLRRLGSTNLEYQFSIAPLVGDLIKLSRAQEQVDRRVREIKRLYEGTGLRRTVSIGVYVSSSQQSRTCQSAGTFITRTFDILTREELKVHCRWKPTSPPGITPVPSQMRMWAVRSVLGLTVDSSTLWELVPWSWLIDWFGGVGDYLKASRNIIPAQLSGVHPMRHIVTTRSCPAYITSGVQMSGIEAKWTTKSRVTSTVLPSAHFPFLNGRQIGLLASIAVTR